MEEKKKSGPKAQEINWEQVRKLCGMQCTRNEIASALLISHDTLERASKKEFGCTIGEKIKEWSVGGYCSLRRAQWNLAQKNAAMAIFLGKQYLGQKDDYRMKNTGNIVLEVVNFADEPKKSEPKETNG